MDNSDKFSSTIELQVDAKSGHLGAPKRITANSTSTSTHQLSITRCGVRGKVVHVQHGTYNGQLASLICFKLYFQFESSSSRFTKAEVRVSFVKTQQEGQNDPVVMKFEPKSVTKPITKAQQREKMSVSLPLSSIVNVGYEKGEVFSKEYFAQIKGMPWYTINPDIENMVIWKASENSKQASGIPHELELALIVQHDLIEFHGTVEIVTWTKSGLKLFGWPWPKPSPLIFEADTSIGSPLDVVAFDELTNEQWTSLISHQ